MAKGNGDMPELGGSGLDKIRGKIKGQQARDSQKEQDAAKRTRDAREKGRQARVRAQRDKKR